MESQSQNSVLLQDYPDRSIWTTWAISYNTIREKDESAANLLLLWSFLDNKDLWHGLFAAACRASATTARWLSEWVGDMASNELKFAQAMGLLRNYSLVEDVEDRASYATHPVVHKWAYHYQDQDCHRKIARLAVVVVGWAVPHSPTKEYSTLERRLLPHAQACFQWVPADELGRSILSYGEWKLNNDETKEKKLILDAILLLGILYSDQGKLSEAEKMFAQALQGKEEALGPKHPSTLDTVNNLGILYAIQGKLDEAEKMCVRALQGIEEALGPKHMSTLTTVHNLGLLYAEQGKLGEAEKLYARALQGYEEALGPKHPSTLDTVNNLGIFYKDQGKLGEAEKMYMRALQGYEEALGLENITRYKPALNTMWNLGHLFKTQEDLTKAKEMFSRAFSGYQARLGPSSDECRRLERALLSLDSSQGKPGD